MAKNDALRLARRTHLWFGLFSAPTLLFLAFTGILQVFSLHEARPGSSFQPPRWIMVLAQVHKNQTDQLAPRKAAIPKPSAAPPEAPKPFKPLPHKPLKIFFAVISVGLFWSILTGIYMAYRYERGKLAVTGWLLAGAIVPLILLWF